VSILLWVVVPYAAFAACVLGHVWRYRFDRFGWDARRRRDDPTHRFGTHLFRTGMLVLILSRTLEFALSDDHTDAPGPIGSVATGVSVTAEVAAIVGMVILLTQSIAAPLRRANPLDRLILPLLGATLVSGAAIMFGPNAGGVGYLPHTMLFPWFRSLLALAPQPSLIATAPLIAQVRGLLVIALIAVWPYTQLVHVFAAPIGSVLRLRPHLSESERAHYPKPM
jgi:nitrate reductase gamma subunit